MNARVAYALGTFFGVGRFTPAPGTLGTLAAVPLYLVLQRGGASTVLAVAALLAVVGGVAASEVSKREGVSDPPCVVVDEVAGTLVALAFSPPRFLWVCAGVVLFRVFDTKKPWPAGWCERRLPGGWGIMLDDLAAAGWVALVLYLVRVCVRW